MLSSRAGAKYTSGVHRNQQQRVRQVAEGGRAKYGPRSFYDILAYPAAALQDGPCHVLVSNEEHNCVSNLF